MTSIRQQALGAYAEVKAQHERMMEDVRQQKRKTRATGLMHALISFGVGVISMDDLVWREEVPYYTTEGLTFSPWEINGGYGLTISVVCPKCHATLIGPRYVQTLVGLGELLADPDNACHCEDEYPA